MKVAVMQPYFMPYLGYFQLIKAVDIFVYYDDVNYIKSGWINRNRILINKEAKYFTVPLIDASSFRMIKDIEIKYESKAYKNLLKTLELNYKKAPYFNDVFHLFEHLLTSKVDSISELAIMGNNSICQYLGIETKFKISSKDFSETKGLERTERLFQICHQLNAEHYINSIGGSDLYSKDTFQEKGIKLDFIQPFKTEYEQFGGEFIPWLSMIDVLMFNSVEAVNEMLDNFELV